MYDEVQDYISDTRTLLQDKIAPFRYDDPSLLVALNAALLRVRYVRPDLLLPHLETVPEYDTVDDMPVPIENQFRPAIVYGIAAHALARDTEENVDERASSYMNTFEDMLLGKRVARMIKPGSSPQ